MHNSMPMPKPVGSAAPSHFSAPASWRKRAGGKATAAATAAAAAAETPAASAGAATKKSEAARNRDTFGPDACATLSDEQRRHFFRRYVMETDRVAAALRDASELNDDKKNDGDDVWPVPYVTSLHLPHHHQQQQHQQTIIPSHPKDVVPHELKQPDLHKHKQAKQLHQYGDQPTRNSFVQQAPPSIHRFAFDRRAVLASMNTPHPA